MRAEVTLPDTTAGRDTAVEVAKRLLRGFSLEFRALKDSINPKGHRIITEGRLFGFGVVDLPAYPDSVASMRSWGEYRTKYGLSVPQPETKRRHFLMV